MQKLRNSTFPCPHCGIVYNLAAFFPQAYYSDVETQCSRCHTTFDFWKIALDSLTKRSALLRTFAASFIGAQQAFFEIDLAPDQVREVTFAEYGVPEDARILYLNYTVEGGGVWPVELHGNEPIRRTTPAAIALYGRPLPKSEGGQAQNKVNIFVTFVVHSPEEHALSNLAAAFDAFLREDYEAVVVPAAVAVEDTMVRLVNDYLSANGFPTKYRPNKLVIREIILPLACSLKALPSQRTHISALIKALWKHRDDMAHTGRLENSLDSDKAAELLCAAMFEVNYLRFIYPHLVGAAGAPPPPHRTYSGDTAPSISGPA